MDPRIAALAAFAGRNGPPTVFDRGGQGYRIGDAKTIAAGTTSTQLWADLDPARVRRVKVFLRTVLASGSSLTPAGAGVGLIYTLTGRVENDVIPKRVIVPVNNAVVLYHHGRSVGLTVENTSSTNLEAHFGVDEEAPGFSPWFTSEQFTGIAAETGLSVPEFCRSLQLFSVGTNGILRGYDSTGTVIYMETLAGPRSAEIPIVPPLRYTLTPAAGTPTFLINYSCFG